MDLILNNVIAAWVCDIAIGHIGPNRQAQVLKEDTGYRLLGYATKEPLPGTNHCGLMRMEVRAFFNPFTPAEFDYKIEDDSPIDDATGQPIPTEVLMHHPPLICFHLDNWDIYRSTMAQSPEIVANIFDEMEAAMRDQYSLEAEEESDRSG